MLKCMPFLKTCCYNWLFFRAELHQFFKSVCFPMLGSTTAYVKKILISLSCDQRGLCLKKNILKWCNLKQCWLGQTMQDYKFYNGKKNLRMWGFKDGTLPDCCSLLLISFVKKRGHTFSLSQVYYFCLPQVHFF